MRNATGSYCRDCKQWFVQRHAQMPIGGCRWCERELTEATRQLGKRGRRELVCRDCDRHRTWLLRCVRLSSWTARYVARIEERESPLRKARQLASAVQPQPLLMLPETREAPTSQRMDRVERMLARLCSELGLDENDGKA
jgi:hypothetical protein